MSEKSIQVVPRVDPPRVWSGPALSNPRNLRTLVVTTKLYELPVEVMNALITGKVDDLPQTEFFDFAGEVMFLGTIEISDVVHAPKEHTFRFHVAPRPNPGSRFWRVFHEIEAVVEPGGDVKVTRVDVAPDDPADDVEHAPRSIR
ncbi:MAG: hypothetical protein WCO25_04390 [Candidatus Uhrbacteria bacterium]